MSSHASQRITTTVDVRGGSLSYSVCGAGPNVLFVQGTGCHGGAWLPQIDALSPTHRCAWFDNRGMGASTAPTSAIDVPSMADDALAVMDALGWSSAHVVGHSLGGLIALEMALRARDRVRSLALLCTFARGRDATGITWHKLWRGIRSRVGSAASRRRAFLEMIVPAEQLVALDRDALAASWAAVFGHDLGETPAVVSAQMRAMHAHDVTARLPELAGLPTLVVKAALDTIVSGPGGTAIARGIPGARFVELAEEGHAVPVLHPATIDALLQQHLAPLG